MDASPPFPNIYGSGSTVIFECSSGRAWLYKKTSLKCWASVPYKYSAKCNVLCAVWVGLLTQCFFCFDCVSDLLSFFVLLCPIIRVEISKRVWAVHVLRGELQGLTWTQWIISKSDKGRTTSPIHPTFFAVSHINMSNIVCYQEWTTLPICHCWD
jgi:hypothetical protein